MPLPEHYAKFYHRTLRFALVMIIFALLSGILFQESSKKASYSLALTAGPHLESVIHLALLHGHVFLIGVLIPLAVMAMLQLGLLLNGKEICKKTLSWGSWLYLPGAALTVILMLYKGYHYLLSVRAGQLDFQAIEHSYFFGQVALRHTLYGLSHTAMGIGLIVFVVAIWKSLSSKKAEVQAVS
jgi:hypothetical protein